MPANHVHLIAACLAMVLLVCAVACALLYTRGEEMRRKRLTPQAMVNSIKMATQLENVAVADNFRNLFETPVLFFALAAIALATGYVPGWMVVCAWVYVALRVLHSVVHCTYNRVIHRSLFFMASFVLLVGMWIAFFMAVAAKSGV